MRTDEAQARASGTPVDGEGRKSSRATAGAEGRATAVERTNAEGPWLMEAVVERGNVWAAYRRVVENKGAPGVDDVTVAEFKDWLKEHWPSVRAALLAGSYLPQAVRAVAIPKPSGGVRLLGIPTVVDRLIQQALLQVLQPIFEPGFSESSYGFRPGRNALQAVKAAQRYVRAGKRWVVDIDLEKFFDRVNHDILMSRVARNVKDTRALKLIRRYLEAGVMQEGLTQPRTQGTPQGGPLSPLLSNILLTDLDRELQRRGHSFCRYADDCNVYVRSRMAAEHAMAEITRFLEKRLALKVNADKSACARPWERKFLGYSLTWQREARLKIAPESLKRLRQKLREQLRAGRGRSLAATISELNPLLRGWMSYFRLTEVKGVLEDLDGWVRRKLRALLWRQWKRVFTRARALMKRGLPRVQAWQSATNGRGAWWNAGAGHMHLAYPKSYFDRMGLVSLVDTRRRFQCLS
ncbi:MAG: group II intron reverse transcriptase/maturase [Gammaproteobacteria bacterium]